MHTLVACCTPWSQTDVIKQFLSQAGMASARPSGSSGIQDIGDWHDRLFRAHPAFDAPLRVGRSWELAAGEIFLANWDQPMWGWVDSRSTWLMEFWCNFDDSTRFLLFFTPAVEVLEHLLHSGGERDFKPDVLVHQWIAYYQEMLRFYHRNRERCVFLNMANLYHAPDALIRHVRDEIHIELKTPPPRFVRKTASRLDAWLSEQLLQSYPAVQQLEQEILACMPVVTTDVLRGESGSTASTAISQLRELYVHQEQQAASAAAQVQELEAARGALRQQTQLAQQTALEVKSLDLELHRLQEELGKHLSESQTWQTKWKRHWHRLAVRYPNYAEWDAVEPCENRGQAAWRVSGLQVLGQSLPPLELSLDQAPNGPVLLLGARDDAEPRLPLYLGAQAGSREAQLISRIGNTDFLAIQTACTALALDLPPDSPQKRNFAAITRWLLQLPAAWRFDSIILKAEQRDPDYEHLWLQIHNARFGERFWPEFEFRIAAAALTEKGFATLPRLEFPLPDGGAAQFERWGDELPDVSGRRFELRFDTDGRAIDIAAWDALTELDKAQLRELLAQLPEMLRRLEKEGAQCGRPWADWEAVCIGMQNTLKALGLADVTPGGAVRT